MRFKFKFILVFFALQLYAFTPLSLCYAAQTLINITEDTLAQDSYKPVAGKEFLVAVKLSEVVSISEKILFTTNVGTLSETEVIVNIYGEAITWLTTSDIADTTHMITATVKDNPAVLPVTIEVQNIALPQNALTAEGLIQQVEDTNSKIQDIKGDITITSNAPWGNSTRVLKIWQKGEKQKVQEISPKPEVFIRPIDTLQIPPMSKDVVAYNQSIGAYVVQTKEENRQQRYPVLYDFVDAAKNIIFKKLSYNEQDDVVSKFIIEDSDYAIISDCLVFQKEKQILYQGINGAAYIDEYQYSNLQVNTGILDSEFSQ